MKTQCTGRSLLRQGGVILLAAAWMGSVATAATVRVVTTLPDYADLAREIGGSRVEVTALVRGDQDAHFLRPKPSYAMAVRRADLLISTGLDLELWLQTVIDRSGNSRIRSGQTGFVAAARDVPLLEKPLTFSRSEGGVHVYGNPHITTSPVNMRIVARNITRGLMRVDPAGREVYQENLQRWLDLLDRRLFGDALVDGVGGDTLCQLAQQHELIEFLQQHSAPDGRPWIEQVGGWFGKMESLRGRQIVTYHKNWVYFNDLFGLQVAGTVEPKPGIPPSARHVNELIERMRAENVRLILAASYFDHQKIRSVATRTGAEAVIVPLYVGGREGLDHYVDLVDFWVDSLLQAAQRAGLLDRSQG